MVELIQFAQELDKILTMNWFSGVGFILFFCSQKLVGKISGAVFIIISLLLEYFL